MQNLQFITEVLADATRKWSRMPPATVAAISQLQGAAGLELPDIYIQFLKVSNGGEGEFGVQPGWFQLWPAECVIEYHSGYEVPLYLPGFFAFAGSGGGDLFVFDARTEQPWNVLAVPCIGMHELEYAHMIGSGFESFLQQIGKSWLATMDAP